MFHVKHRGRIIKVATRSHVKLATDTRRSPYALRDGRTAYPASADNLDAITRRDTRRVASPGAAHTREPNPPDPDRRRTGRTHPSPPYVFGPGTAHVASRTRRTMDEVGTVLARMCLAPCAVGAAAAVVPRVHAAPSVHRAPRTLPTALRRAQRPARSAHTTLIRRRKPRSCRNTAPCAARDARTSGEASVPRVGSSTDSIATSTAVRGDRPCFT